MREYTIPSEDDIRIMHAQRHPYMREDFSPYVAVYERYFSKGYCFSILDIAAGLPAYRHEGCGAVTVEIIEMAGLAEVQAILRQANNQYFQYDIDGPMVAWLQTYQVGNKYPNHWDHRPGQSRKLTALVILSDERQYTLGSLNFNFPGKHVQLRPPQGTVLVYPSWVPHEVALVGSGFRQTLNLGAWGPPFR